MEAKIDKYDEELAMSQGWLLADNTDYGVRIEWYDEDPLQRFASDEEAFDFVLNLATDDDAHAIYCVEEVYRARLH